MVASDYPFLDVMWTMIVFFAWVFWFMLVIRVFIDVFRRHDLSGFGKVGWLIFVIVLPFLGVFVYVIAQGKGMGERDISKAQASQAQFDDYVRSVSGGGGAADIEKAKGLLDSGAITQAEFEQLKAKALASS